MKRNLLLIVLFGIFGLVSCKVTFSVSYTISIMTSKEQIETDLQKAKAIVLSLNKQQIENEIYSQYPDAMKKYVESVRIKFIKETKKNLTNNSEKVFLKVKIVMNYEKSKSDQAGQIIKFYKNIISDEFIKNGLQLSDK